MNKKNYSKPETLVVELKHRSYILQNSDPDPDPSGDETGGGADPEGRLNSNDAQYLWT